MQRFCLALFLAVAVVFPAAAQVLYGTLTGTIHDSAGAVVPTAAIKVQNVGTAQEFTAQTNELGGYTFTNLAPG
ncbi:MAG: carboxypeptidase-like regulatory domain-containing protein, partial [Phycisphaerales bacterium]|nr:carboxypeptidase-like regulatory domain-containing protein [Phycisphaerales bacterium]